MLPPQYVEALKRAPVEDCDFVGTFFEVFIPLSVIRAIMAVLTRLRCLKGSIPQWGTGLPYTRG